MSRAAHARGALQARKRDVRRTMAHARTHALAQVSALPAVQRLRARRRQRRLLALLLLCLLLLLLMLRCEAAGPVPLAPPPPTTAAAKIASVPLATATVAKRRPLAGRMSAQPRGRLHNELSAAPEWLQELRLQVAARSPRLAACFNGARRPGAWRWGAAVDAHTGAVSDHTLEPVGSASSVSDKQRECLLNVLSAPRYRLPLADDERDPAFARRVSVLIEF
jgi:hypothetical protein